MRDRFGQWRCSTAFLSSLRSPARMRQRERSKRSRKKAGACGRYRTISRAESRRPGTAIRLRAPSPSRAPLSSHHRHARWKKEIFVFNHFLPEKLEARRLFDGACSGPPPQLADDFGNDAAHAEPLDKSLAAQGHLEGQSDQDWFSFQ